MNKAFIPILLVIFLALGVMIIPQLPDYFHQLNYTRIIYITLAGVVILSVTGIAYSRSR